MESVMRLIEVHPEFSDMYHEIAEFRREPEELIGMFSEALYIMDRNTEKYMVDELKEKVKLAEQKLEQIKQENEAVRQESEIVRQELEAEKKRADSAEARATELEAVIAGMKE